MRFQQDGKIYDTDKARHIFTNPATGWGYYVTKGGTYFTAHLEKMPVGWGWLWPKFEMRPWGHRVTVHEVQCKAFDLGLDLPALGLEPLSEAE